MKRIFLLALVALMSVGLTACGGKSDEEKAEDMVAEYKQLINELNSIGYPSTSWSESKLNDYIKKLNRLESIEAQADSNDHIVRYGSNQRFIDQRRAAARDALQAKRTKKTNAENIRKLDALNIKMQRKSRTLLVLGQPKATWTDDALNNYVKDADEILELNIQSQNLVNDMRGVDYSKKRQLVQDYKKLYESIEDLKEKAQEELNKRAAALVLDKEAV